MNLFGKWKDQATQYVDVRVQLAKLKFIERTSHVLSHLMLGFVLMVVSIVVLIFLGFGIMESFTTLFESRTGGAFATAVIFALFIAILFGLRRRILTSFADLFVRIMTDNNDDDDDDEDERERKKNVRAEEL